MDLICNDIQEGGDWALGRRHGRCRYCCRCDPCRHSRVWVDQRSSPDGLHHIVSVHRNRDHDDGVLRHPIYVEHSTGAHQQLGSMMRATFPGSRSTSDHDSHPKCLERRRAPLLTEVLVQAEHLEQPCRCSPSQDLPNHERFDVHHPCLVPILLHSSPTTLKHESQKSQLYKGCRHRTTPRHPHSPIVRPLLRFHPK